MRVESRSARPSRPRSLIHPGAVAGVPVLLHSLPPAPGVPGLSTRTRPARQANGVPLRATAAAGADTGEVAKRDPGAAPPVRANEADRRADRRQTVPARRSYSHLARRKRHHMNAQATAM